MKPHVICHMIATIDGKIDCESIEAVSKGDDYEETGAELKGDAWVCGRVTMQYFADEAPFFSTTNRLAGPQSVHVARKADSYAISVDTLGKLRWSTGDLDGAHLICIVSEKVAEDYLTMLREKEVSYIVAGEKAIDLTRAVSLLGEHFGIRRLLLEGGGHINGAFLDAGLVDEISLLIAPGVDGRHGQTTVFDGIGPSKTASTLLRIKSVEQRVGDILWIRYDVLRQ